MALPNLDTFFKGFLCPSVDKKQLKTEDQTPSANNVIHNGYSDSTSDAEACGDSSVNILKRKADIDPTSDGKMVLQKLDFETSWDGDCQEAADSQEMQNENMKTVKGSVNSQTLKSNLISQIDPKSLPNIQFSPSASKVNPYKVFKRDFNNHSGSGAINHQSLSVNKQMENLISSQLLTDEQLRVRWQIVADILLLVRGSRYPNCELYVFGSLLTGLSNFKSDIDIYMDFKGDGGVSLDQRPSAKPLNIYSAQENVLNIMKDSVCPHAPNKRFAEQVEAIGTRVPIVRFQHVQTSVNVDISFGSRVSVQNSKLLIFYMDYDPRVKPLMLFLRYWADFHGIAGSQKIKNYALSLLAIVYLTSKKIIPSIRLLQTLSEAVRFKAKKKDNPDHIEGWDCSFCTDRETIEIFFDADPLPANYNKNVGNVVLKMAMEFFEMMANTDFSKYVVCPFMGKVIPKETFLSLSDAEKDLPTTLVNWRRTYTCDRTFCQDLRIFKPLVIQDPFVLDFNVGGLVDEDTLKRFIDVCKSTVGMLKTEPETVLQRYQLASCIPHQ